MKKTILFILLACLSVFPQSRPKFLAHYMPWYQAPPTSSTWGWHWTMNHYNPGRVFPNGEREIASQYYPLTGPYDSADKLILEYQALLMKISGIDGVLVDWYGNTDYNDYKYINTCTNLLFSAIDKASLEFAIVYEDQTVKNLVDGGKLSAANVLTHGKSTMKYLWDTWFSKGAYTKLGNKPLLLTFGPQYYKSSAQWDTLFKALQVKPAFYTLDYRLSPAAMGSYPWPPMSKSVNGILSQSSLNSYLSTFYQNAASYEYMVTSAFPGFNDIYKQAGVGSSYGYLDAGNGLTFQNTLKQATDHNPAVIQLVTWNDYGEGTGIEPTSDFGYRYLEMVRAVRDSLDSSFVFTDDDLRQPIKLYNLRVKYKSNAQINTALDKAYSYIITQQPAASLAILDSLASITAVEDKILAVPSEFMLDQNYPNPFNPVTTLSYRVSEPGMVILKIYDVMGKEVDTLVKEEKNTGSYKAIFNASGFSSGIYYARLISGSNQMTKKLVLIK